MTAPALPGVAYAEANHGRWIAQCPAPFCSSAMQIVIGQDAFLCGGNGGCGATAPLVWPADPDGIQALLLMRPVPATRNWLPGETLEQLIAENAEHGCIPAEWLALGDADPQLVLADIVDQRVTGGLLLLALPESDPRRQLAADRSAAHDHDLPFVEPDGVVTYAPHPELEV